MKTLKLDTTEIEFTHKKNKKLKYAYISISPDKGIVVKTPNYSNKQVVELLYKKKSWIKKKLDVIKQKKALTKTSKNYFEEIFYLGKSYKLDIIKIDNIENTKLIFDDSIFTFFCYDQKENLEIFKNLLDYFYKEKAELIIRPLVKSWSEKIELYPNKVSFRKAHKRLGSCNSKDYLSFNYRIMSLPIEYIEYVVVHELAHIKHKNHSKHFWDFVKTYIPKEIIKFSLNQVNF